MRYINYKYNGENETIDQCDSFKEAVYLLGEYKMADPSGDYWISNRKCKGW